MPRTSAVLTVPCGGAGVGLRPPVATSRSPSPGKGDRAETPSQPCGVLL